jgi:hypothetical protein
MRSSRISQLGFCLALVACSLAFNVAVSEEGKDLEFKGFVFGKTTLSEWKKAVHEVGLDRRYPDGLKEKMVIAPDCKEEERRSDNTETALGIKRCSWYTSDARYAQDRKSFAVGGVSTVHDEWVFVDGVLTLFSAITHPHELPGLLRPLQAKYGDPSRIQTEKLHNAFRAEFTNYIYEWQLGSMQITVTKYSGDLNTSRIVISNLALSKELKRRRDSVPVDKSGL